jgi:hypothetical protein
MRNRYLLLSAAIILLISLPYVLASVYTSPDSIFGGFLLNPLDGNSYLAKMREGWEGAWKFTLSYSAVTNQGEYLFLFYIFLGHISRWFGISTILVFHLTRIFSAFALLVALRHFLTVIFADRPKVAFWAFAFSAAGSGLGWLAALFGGFTSDFWVAEAYPFLSMYSSPHFSLGLAILLWYLVQDCLPFQKKAIPVLVAAGFLLGIIFPFAIVVAAVITCGGIAYDFISRNKIRWQTPLFFLAIGGLTILYQFIVIRTDPILAGWDKQNQTPSPELLDFVISFSPFIFFAIVEAYWAFRTHNRNAVFLATWLILGLFLIYLPFSLQRRFLLGYMIPVAGLAASGIERLAVKKTKIVSLLAICITLPTLTIILFGGVGSVKNPDSPLVINKVEKNGIDYLAKNGRPGEIVLASPQTGSIIPAYTGLRVLYGHPFETVNALAEKALVEKFFTNSLNTESLNWAKTRGVDWVIWGPIENQISVLPTELPKDLIMVFDGVDIKVFKLTDVP